MGIICPHHSLEDPLPRWEVHEHGESLHEEGRIELSRENAGSNPAGPRWPVDGGKVARQ